MGDITADIASPRGGIIIIRDSIAPRAGHNHLTVMAEMTSRTPDLFLAVIAARGR